MQHEHLEHIERLEDGGMLVLRPGRDGEAELVMHSTTDLLGRPAVQVRYPAPHSPQWITPTEAEGLLEVYRGTITHYL